MELMFAPVSDDGAAAAAEPVETLGIGAEVEAKLWDDVDRRKVRCQTSRVPSHILCGPRCD
jgi:hypothetical protein